MRLLGLILSYSLVPLLIHAQSGSEKVANERIHTFYYNWYGNPEHDGAYYHWKHDILPHWSDTTWNNAGTFPGGDDIGANFYPSLGCYSSNDTSVIAQHMRWIREAGIGVVVITWWGEGSYEDRSLGLYLDQAEKSGLKVAVHLEPFYQTVEAARKEIVYLFERYGQHPAWYRLNNRPMIYVYDSYRLPAQEWLKLLGPTGELSVRGTAYDAVFIGLWVKENEEKFFMTSGFDGFYTYFASSGFEYGCTPENWLVMSEFARSAGLLFIPCVGPGYIDTRIRPWNAQNTEERDGGKYYEQMFQAAAATEPDFIGITSFNEWHEGTQIEPAVPKKIERFRYEEYDQRSPDYYLKLTRELIETYMRQ